MDKLTDEYAATMRDADPEIRQAAIDALEDASAAWKVEYDALTAEVGAYGQKKMRAGLLLASRLASLRAGNIRALE